MFSLAHISDIHLSPLPAMRTRELISKRITGYANWKFNRAKTHTGDALSPLIADLKAHTPDHIAVTGDLVNLALGLEFDATARWLHNLGSAADISVIPGNHDAYVPGALTKAHVAWGNYMPLGTPSVRTDDAVDSCFPFVRRLGKVAIIGVSSAVASIPFLATGRFREDQARRLKEILQSTKNEGLFRVILIHHPPFRYDGDVSRRLYGIRLFQKTVLEAGAELILHGHTHLATSVQIGSGGKAIPVICVPSASQTPGGSKPAAQWNEFKISGNAGAWNCQWSARGVQPDMTVSEISTNHLWQNGARVQA